MSQAGPPPLPAARQGVAARLATALDGLGRRISAQRDRLLEACTLAPRAEDAALRARLLAYGSGASESATALATDIGALAARAGDLAADARRAAAGSETTAGALAGHAATLAALAHGPEGAAGGATARRLLAPLAGVLEGLTAQQQMQRSVGAGVTAFAAQATTLAASTDRLATADGASGAADARQLLAELNDLALTASRIGAAIERDSGTSRAAVETAVAHELRTMTAEPPPPVMPAPAAPPRRFGKAVPWAGVSRLT